MITDINRFNESDCKQREQKIKASHDYDDFKTKMLKRLTEQQKAAKKADLNQPQFDPPSVVRSAETQSV
jgi:hypothetical protein